MPQTSKTNYISSRKQSNKSQFLDLKCFSCDQILSGRLDMIEHIKRFHSESIVETSDDTRLECYTCGRRYRYKRGIIEHIRLRHPDLITNKVDFESNRNFACSFCRNKYSYKRGLMAHVKYRHPEVVKERPRNFSCQLCHRKYSYARGLREHFKKRHFFSIFPPIQNQSKDDENIEEKFKLETLPSVSMRLLSEYEKEYGFNKPYICAHCNQVYNFRRRLIQHIMVQHPSTIHTKGVLKAAIRVCPICRTSHVKRKHIVDHFDKVHDIELECMSLQFDDRKTFDEWKKNLESNTCSRYVLYNRYQSDTESVTHYVCQRSGVHCSRAIGLHNSRRVSSKKMDAFCPAEIRLRSPIMSSIRQLHVDYCATHVGHDTAGLRFFATSKDDRMVSEPSKILDMERLNKYVAACGLDNDDATFLLLSWDDYADEQSNSEVVHCVESAKNLDRLCVTETSLDELELANAVEDVNVQLWIQDNAEFVFFAKHKGVDNPFAASLNRDDFVLAVMDESQLDVLKTFGANVIAMDRCQLAPTAYELFTLSVLDATHTEFVCVHMFSNRCDENVYRALFEKLRERCGVLTARVLITDATDTCANGWNAVMRPPSRHLYCAQHVNADWRRQLDGAAAASPQKRRETMRLLQALQRELNPYRFHERLDTWTASPSAGLATFSRFFDEKYTKRTSRWAYCYRSHAGVNTSQAANRFAAAAAAAMAVDDRTDALSLTHVLDSLIRQFYEQQTLVEADTKPAPKICDLQFKHCLAASNADALRTVSRLVADQLVWFVPALDAEDEKSAVHRVELVKERCECDLRCELCAACLHTFTCTCVDNSVEFNMCEHIHLVCLYQQQCVEERIVGFEMEADVDADDDAEELIVKVELCEGEDCEDRSKMLKDSISAVTIVS